MSDKEVAIHFKTTSDLAGVNTTKEAIEEVTEELDELEEKAQTVAEGVEKTLDVAGKSGTKEAIEEVTEELDELEEKTQTASAGVAKTLDTAGKNATKVGNQVATAGAKGASGFTKLGQGALNAAYFIDDMQYGIRGVMNNIPSLVLSLGGGAGLAGALSIAAVGFSKLYDWMNKDAKAAEDLAKANKEAAETLIKAGKEASKSLANEESLKRVLELNKETNEQRRISLNLIRETAEEQRRQILMESKVLDAFDKKQLARVELAYLRGRYGEVGSLEAKQKRAEAEASIIEDSEQRKRDEAMRVAEVGLKEAEANHDLRYTRYREALADDKRFRDKRAMSPDELKVSEGNIEELTNKLAEHLLGNAKAGRSEIGRFLGHLGLNRQTTADLRIDTANLAKKLIAEYVDPYTGEANTFGQDLRTAALMKEIAKEMHRVQGFHDLLEEMKFSTDEEGAKQFFEASKESEKNKLEALGKWKEAKEALEKEQDAHTMQEKVNKEEQATSQIKQETRQEKYMDEKRKEDEKNERSKQEANLKTEIERLKEEVKRLEKEQDPEKAFEIASRGKKWERDKTEAMAEVGQQMAKSVQSAMDDGRVDEREAKELLAGFRSAMEHQGLGYNEQGGRNFLREVIAVMQGFHAQQQSMRGALDKATKALEQLKSQSKQARF